MKCRVCNATTSKTVILKGPGRKPEAVPLCKKHADGFDDYRKNLGK